MSDLSYEHPIELGEQPFVTTFQTEVAHTAEREVAKVDAQSVLARIETFAQNELDSLGECTNSRAYASLRSHLGFIISQSRHLFDSLPR